MWKKALIIGLGKSGQGALHLLSSYNVEIIAVDKNENLFTPQKHISFFKDTDDVDLSDVDVAVLSPGIPLSHKIVKEVEKKAIPLISEIELGLKFCKNKIVGITGSNGKTTTTLLIEFILNQTKRSAKALGNVGRSFCESLKEVNKEDIIVLELSSYQLETVYSKNLIAATILNITPDHMDRYKTLEDYAKAKCRIFSLLKKEGFLFVNKDVYEKFFKNNKRVKNFEDIAKVCPKLYVPCRIAKENLIAAFSICKELGVKEEEFFSKINEFKLPPHRLEFVAEVNKVCFYNDSKATNVEAVLNALEKVMPPVILIAGGLDKHLSFEKLNVACKGRVKCVFAIGQCAEKIKTEITNVPVYIVTTLQEAVNKAYSEAKIKDNILLAPACASFDMFKNYEHRGEEFKRCVKAIEERVK